MTLSQTPEAAGLEVVAWRWKGFDSYFVVNPNQPKPFDAEPLVTAASAQAAIDAEKARADRYYEALVQADLTIRSFAGTDQSDVEFIRAALQQETQP